MHAHTPPCPTAPHCTCRRCWYIQGGCKLVLQGGMCACPPPSLPARYAACKIHCGVRIYAQVWGDLQRATLHTDLPTSPAGRPFPRCHRAPAQLQTTPPCKTRLPLLGCYCTSGVHSQYCSGCETPLPVSYAVRTPRYLTGRSIKVDTPLPARHAIATPYVYLPTKRLYRPQEHRRTTLGESSQATRSGSPASSGTAQASRLGTRCTVLRNVS